MLYIGGEKVGKKYPKHVAKLINYYFKNLFNFRKE